MKETYITKEEREKCAKVVEAFAELYDFGEAITLDAGKYGFVVLLYYSETDGFDGIITFTKSDELFEYLWDSWLTHQLFHLTLNTPLEESRYEEMFDSLPKEKQQELMQKKQKFAQKAEKK